MTMFNQQNGMKIKPRNWMASSLALALALCAGAPGVAQALDAPPAPAAPGAPGAGGAAPNPDLRTRQTERRAEREREMQRFMNMTPEERQQWMQQRREEGLRTLMERSGVTDKTTQDAIIEWMRTEEKEREAVRATGRKVAEAVRTGAVTDTQMSILMNEFRNVVLDEKTRRAASARALDQKIGYSTKPRLEAMLVTMGLIGDEASYMTGATGIAGLPGFQGIVIQGMMPGMAGAAGRAGAVRGGVMRGQNGAARGQGNARRRNRGGQGGDAPAATPGAPAPGAPAQP